MDRKKRSAVNKATYAASRFNSAPQDEGFSLDNPPSETFGNTLTSTPHIQDVANFVSKLSAAGYYVVGINGSEMLDNPSLNPHGLNPDLLKQAHDIADAFRRSFHTEITLPDGKVITCSADGFTFDGVARELEVTGVLLEGGESVGTWTRSLNFEGFPEKSEGYAQYELLEIGKEYQNLRLGTKLLVHFDSVMLAAGVTEVRLHANMDIGGYAWAKAGYDWDQSETSEFVPNKEHKLQGRLRKYANEHVDPGGQIKEMINRLNKPYDSNYPTPLEVALLGRDSKDRSGLWAGKKALLNSKWDAVRRLV